MLEHIIIDILIVLTGWLAFYLIVMLRSSQSSDRTMEEFVKYKQTVQKITGIDPLTGLITRSAFFDMLDMLARDLQSSFSVLFIDIDGFKHINDTLGHVKGDLIIQKVSAKIGAAVRPCDTVARMGGDEFAVIVDTNGRGSNIKAICERILASVRHAIRIDHDRIDLSVSIGIVSYPTDADNITDLLRFADITLYEAKKNGKNRYEFFTIGMSDQFHEQQFIEQKLKDCLENQQETFIVYYQPKIDITTGEIVGAEALLRWKPDDTIISPTRFIPVAESTGLIDNLGNIVLMRVSNFIQDIIAKGMHINIAVNVSPHQFTNDGLCEAITTLFTPRLLKFLDVEITESSFMNNRNKTIEVLKSLHNSGVSIALDDFGTGWSNLGYLTDFPIDVLKIDKSFIDQVNHGDTRIIDTIISMAKILNLNIVAEGVETLEQSEYLREKGVNIVQGFRYARPMPEDDFLRYLEAAKSV